VVGYRPVKLREVSAGDVPQTLSPGHRVNFTIQYQDLHADGRVLMANVGDDIEFSVQGRGCIYASIYREY
jgi:hypothetical protein